LKETPKKVTRRMTRLRKKKHPFQVAFYLTDHFTANSSGCRWRQSWRYGCRRRTNRTKWRQPRRRSCPPPCS
jgi:hypothetical protein